MQQKSPVVRRYLRWALLIVLIVVAALILRGYAKYLQGAVEAENTFKPAASVEPPVEETFETGGTEKSDVQIAVDEEGNRTEYPVYVRAAIVITWQRIETDVKGDTIITYYATPEENTDYTIEFNTDDWTLEDDGYYYYQYIVPSGGTTTDLITKCVALKDFTDEYGNLYTLSVNILPQTVQAIGYTDEDNPIKGNVPAVEDAWGWENAPTDYYQPETPEP